MRASQGCRHTVATGVAGEPTAPGSRSGGAVSRKRLRLFALSQSPSSDSRQISPRFTPVLNRQWWCSGSITQSPGLKDVGISSIYTTQFKRTIQTGAPLADLLKIKLLAYEQTDVDGVVKEIRQKHPKEVVMVVGHRSTVPQILKQFGASEPVALGSSEYDSLFILTLPPGQSPTLLHLRF